MKKQINPTIKAHLIRSAFYLLLLLAVCAIPFALAQRNATKRSTAKPVTKPSAVTIAQLSRNSSSMDGTVRAQSRSPRDRVPAATDLAKKRPSSPTKSYRSRSPVFARTLSAPKLPAVVLYDQYNNAGTAATSSQDFEAADDAFDDFTADDFVVPAGQTWNVSEIDIQGTYDGFPGPAVAFHVFFYQDSGGLPGAQVYSAMNQSYTTGNNVDFVINLSTAAVLSPGTYWVSVQCRMDFGVGGQWYWTDRTVTSNSPAAWENPGGGFGAGCLTWGVRTS